MAYRFDKPVIALVLLPQEANALDDLVGMAVTDPQWQFLNIDALIQVKVKLRAEATNMRSPGKRRRAREARKVASGLDSEVTPRNETEQKPIPTKQGG